MNLETMTLAELEAANQALGLEIDALRDKRRAINAVRDRKMTEQRMERLGLSDSDVQVLVETLKARGAAQPAKG